MMQHNELTITKAHEALTKGEMTVRQLTDLYLQHVHARNKDLNIYLEVFDDIDAQVEAAQKKIDAGEATMLTGIPLSMKDVICIKGRQASGGSKILENYVAPYDATVIEKLKEHTPVFIGRTNTDEFAQGASTENSAYGVTKNPHDDTRVAGGSSGGATASIAADMALGGLGSDTGGSIREPASFCGVVGLKPTYGSVSRYGLMAMASSFDVISPTTKTVTDAKIMFDAIRGKDERDSTSIDAGPNVSSDVKTVGVMRDFLEGVDEDVLENFNRGITELEEKGYEIKDISIPHIEKALSVYYILVPAEVSSNMARYDGVKFGEKIIGKDLQETYFKTRGQLLGPEVKRRIMLGTYVLSSGYTDQFYRKAWQVRTMIREQFKKAFEAVDVIAMPVAPTPAFKIGERSHDPLQMYLIDIYTVIANVVGIPALSVPHGTVDRDGKALPVGLQFLAPHLHEERLFTIGEVVEKISQ